MRKIRDSLSAKVFLWVLCALLLCSFLVYAAVMLILPRQYTVLTNARMERTIAQLASELDGADYASASEAIYQFCMENRASAMLIHGEQTVVFGEESGLEESENALSISFALRFSDSVESSVLTVISSASAAGEITETFLKILPLVAALILLLSALSALFCSRLIVRPVLEISSVSKRMAQMDMTWHCRTGRGDELGALADSLNTLSQRLTQAMGELEAANARLQEDVAASRALEKQRRDFFAAASHELKTPITILRGQLESMALGIGDYKNHEKYFPQALAVVQNIEDLIQELLAVSKMEAGVPESSFSNEVLFPLLWDCIHEEEPLAAEKRIVIDTRQVSETASAYINRPLFQKAISNLLSNAVRYTPPGQRVHIALTENMLSVENTGVTIAEDDLRDIFSPFYRVEQSRNRKSGGSGLGLYIVKTILDLHGFSCKMENRDNAVRFEMNFNQN